MVYRRVMMVMCASKSIVHAIPKIQRQVREKKVSPVSESWLALCNRYIICAIDESIGNYIYSIEKMSWISNSKQGSLWLFCVHTFINERAISRIKVLLV